MKTHTDIICEIFLDLMDYNKMINKLLYDKLYMYQRLQFKFVE